MRKKTGRQDQIYKKTSMSPKAIKCLTDVFVVSENGELFRLDTQNLVWNQKARCPGNLHRSSVAAGDGKILACRGRDSCFVYTVDEDTWITGNLPHHQHYAGGLVWINDSFLFLGGAHADDVEEYDIESDTWKEAEFKCPMMNDFVHAFAVKMPV